MTVTRVKICCIGSVEEAELAVRCGASALGLVSAMPSGPGVIAESLIADIAATVPSGVASVLLTSRQDVVSIVDQQRRCRVNTIQICDRLTTGTYQELRTVLPGVRLMHVIHVSGEAALLEARQVAPEVDAILLDSGNPGLPVKELGGTGRTHDWQISRSIRAEVRAPVFLAGGLRADNVGQAIRQVRPYGVDVCSGVRTNGRLDAEKLRAFFEAVGRADAT
jgi:phosphoribosylanthranilate isomerase